MKRVNQRFTSISLPMQLPAVYMSATILMATFCYSVATDNVLNACFSEMTFLNQEILNSI